MDDRAPDLHMVNLIVADMRASLDFYRLLGVAIPDDADAAGSHVQLRMPGGFSLELDSAESARRWHAAWRADPASAAVVVGFSLSSRRAVDERYAELTSAGYPGRQPPFDAFWGARYAIVADPDGNDVGLMSPVDETRRTWPPPESPPAPDSQGPDRLAALMPFARHLGLVVDEASPDRVVARLAWAPHLCTAGGIMHGGVLMSLADTAGAFVTFLGLPAGATTATITSTSQLFRPVTGGTVRAEAVPLHRGRTTVTAQTSLYDSEQRMVAQTTQIQAVLR